MPTNAASTPLTLRRVGIALGTAFVGSTLVAVASPVGAEPTEPGEPSAEPVPVASVVFARDADSVTPGRQAPPNTLTVSNIGDIDICVIGMRVTEGFTADGLDGGLLAAGAADTVAVTGSPRRSTDVVATLTFAAADPETGCTVPPADVHTLSSGVWAVTVTRPVPSPTPTPTPSPSEPPSESPSPSPSGRPTPSATPTEDRGTPRPTPRPSATGTPGPSNGATSRPSSTSTPQTPGAPQSTVSDAPTTGANIPTLPRDEAALPDVLPGEDLATLPLATPTETDDGAAAETEVAAEHTDMGPNMAPAVLLAAFLLTLLLAAPLAPTRRVRPGPGGYQGRRRKG
ncbi:hypothetical protein SUDANB121_03693 [Nocardiopsis dassonvillei]|uniref:hypothetical protein n=1 Tax=Nocardiopsis dassonvillei TaxID=2014 RepID=UPI003F554AAF